MTIGLDDGTTYISFRGTDDTIVGWKEDFNLSNGVVPSHRKALEYLETHGTYIQSMLRIGGHSKGGNLAIDVYKRQACVLVTGWNYMAALKTVYAPLNKYRKAVSYTHLDVYKRQA